MAKKQRMTASQQDGVQYARAKTWQIALSQMCCAAGMCFYMLMTYATYIGNANYGILVGVTGVIMTVSRFFDGVTDPICAYVIERFNGKHGKIRIFMLLGWAIMALATTAMCNWGAGHLDGIGGLIFFIVCYFVYIIGYTLQNVAGNIIGCVMTNDPRQRPVFSVWGTVFGYITPTVLTMVSMAMILPKYDDVIGTGFLAEYNIFLIFLALVFYVLSCVGVSAYDKPESFEDVQIGEKKEEKISLMDMWRLVRENKELQRFMVAACSDKLAQTIGSASVITTMLFGILIGNLSISSIISAVAMFPSIIFAIVGARLAGRQGNKKVVVQWTWVCIIINIIFALVLLFTDTTKITVAIVPTIIFMILMLGNSSAKMVVSTASSAMRMDVVDYETYRSGRYLPASVTATYTFIDKIVSAIGAVIPTLLIGIIGYTSTTPQQGDPLTLGVRIMTVLIYCGVPIIGWICTVISMKKFSLTKEKMVEVQKVNSERKVSATEEIV